MTLQQVSDNKVCGGQHQQYTHISITTQCTMRFALFLPPQATQGQRVPVVYWLSGLTCTDENFMQKAGAFKKAAELGLAIVAPDTSPRGDGVADDPEAASDFGLGAGFYVNAIQEPFAKHYQMYSYVADELPQLIETHFPVTSQRAISGHSMGGHGAMMIGLRNPTRYSSITAFSPIANPSDCPWGQKAFSGYLGDDRTFWQEYNSCELIKQASTGPEILVDQGDSDPFLEQQLKPDSLQTAAELSGYPLTLRIQPGYDHSYYFISSFIDEHLAFHFKHLSQ